MSLLPPNATAFEKALVDVIGRAYERLAPHPETLKNAKLIDSHLLPWLAWHYSVDSWDSNWPEPVKRSMIQHAIDIHRRKGTAGALKDAVLLVYPDAAISEWFDFDGKPYLFAIDIYMALDAFDWDAALRLIFNNKNARSHFQLTLSTQAAMTTYAQAVAVSEHHHTMALSYHFRVEPRLYAALTPVITQQSMITIN